MYIPLNRHTMLNVLGLTVAHLSHTSDERNVSIYQEHSFLNDIVNDDEIDGASFSIGSSIYN